MYIFAGFILFYLTLCMSLKTVASGRGRVLLTVKVLKMECLTIFFSLLSMIRAHGIMGRKRK
jgi:hypothetical protein